MPKPLGKPVRITGFVDADHAGDQMTCRSYTGILLYVNRALISSYSKRQNTVEAATFGSELIAGRIAKEKIEALTYKLRMFGIPVIGPANVYVDNESVVKSVTTPDSRLKKKHLSICYHAVREEVAAGKIRIGWIESDKNLADLLTKILPGPKLRELSGKVLY